MGKNSFETVGEISQQELRNDMREQGFSQEFFDRSDAVQSQLKALEGELGKMMRERIRQGGVVVGGDLSLQEGELAKKIASLRLEMERIYLDEELRIDREKKI